MAAAGMQIDYQAQGQQSQQVLNPQQFQVQQLQAAAAAAAAQSQELPPLALAPVQQPLSPGAELRNQQMLIEQQQLQQPQSQLYAADPAAAAAGSDGGAAGMVVAHAVDVPTSFA